MWAVSAGLIAWCARKVKVTRDDRLVPMMGVLGAFIFTAMMINFSIPGTGSSGHLGGGLILTILLGPHAAFLVMASVLTVQALFFADGGLLALGCNIFNLGFFPAFVAYPLIYRLVIKDYLGIRSWVAALLAAIVGLQLGALSVVLETMASGISALPFRAFVMLMQPIHLAIGVVEGLATAVLVGFLASARPEALVSAPGISGAGVRLRSVIAGLLLAAAMTGGVLSWFASARPDGLEWAITHITGQGDLEGSQDGPHVRAARFQKGTALLPGYGFKQSETGNADAVSPSEPWPAVNAGTSFSGIVGGLLTLGMAGALGWCLRARRVVA